MTRVCLPQKYADKMKQALKSGDINIEDLYKMTSKDRNAFFSKLVGDNASIVNAKLEQAMLSNQKKALKNWVESTISTKDPIRRDMLKKVGKIEKYLTPDEQFGFLDDLAEMKLGLKVTQEEAEGLVKLKSTIDDLRGKIPEDSPIGSTERLNYGFAVDIFKKTVGDMKVRAEALTPTERLKPQNYLRNLFDASGVAKALKASFDISFVGRQGIKSLWDGNYRAWFNAVRVAFGSFGKELMAKNPGLFKSRGEAVMSAIRADIYSRPNALNGKYNAAKGGYGLGVLYEEAFPSSLPEKLPFLGRIFKASESSFNGAALRLRADLADAQIALREANGIDMLDEKNATSASLLVESMTGRGNIGKLEVLSKEINAAVFSIKFLKSNFDTLTAHVFNKNVTKADKVRALKSTTRIGMSIATTLVVANMINPGSAGVDPRNRKTFGKIKVGDRWIDITGGLAGLASFGFMFVPTLHDGELGFWQYSENTKKWKKFGSGAFAEDTLLDSTVDFFKGKLSPLAGAFRDMLEWRTYSGEPPTVGSTLVSLGIPISAELLYEELQKGSDDLLIAMMAESIGLSPTNAIPQGYTKQWKEVKEKVSPEKYNELAKKVAEEYTKGVERLQNSPKWERMNNDERNKELDKLRKQITDKQLRRYQ